MSLLTELVCAEYYVRFDKKIILQPRKFELNQEGIVKGCLFLIISPVLVFLALFRLIWVLLLEKSFPDNLHVSTKFRDKTLMQGRTLQNNIADSNILLLFFLSIYAWFAMMKLYDVHLIVKSSVTLALLRIFESFIFPSSVFVFFFFLMMATGCGSTFKKDVSCLLFFLGIIPIFLALFDNKSVYLFFQAFPPYILAIFGLWLVFSALLIRVLIFLERKVLTLESQKTNKEA